MSSTELDIARQIGLDRQAEAHASALAATFRLARRERRLQGRLLRVAAQVGSRDHAA
jgi:hypothetical protein